MIAIRVPKAKSRKSNFARLAKYVTNSQNKLDRVGEVSISNCEAQTLDGAIAEVLATQGQNTRAKSDKTYHLLISFRPGEHPDDATLKIIEDRICSGLGYGQHQRVSGVHHDTNNIHIHVAINKIHPTYLTIHDPYNDFKIIGQLCEKLEQEFGLEVDNHKASKNLSENRAANMEHHTGIESLLSWIKRDCLEQIQGAKNWADLHQVMQANGLELRERGNGFVITDSAGFAVKASSASRDLSKAQLEKKLGAFEKRAGGQISDKQRQQISQRTGVSPVGQNPPPRSRNRSHNLDQLEAIEIDNGRRYRQRPLHSKDTVELYTKYKDEQRNNGASRSVEWTSARVGKNHLIEAAKRTGRLKRAAIKLLSGAGVNKKVLYALTSKTLKSDIEKINKQYLQERQSIQEEYRQRAWADWLKVKAVNGDSQALAALRSRDTRQNLKGNTVSGKKVINTGSVLGVTQDSITKTGIIIYHTGTSAIRDDGDSLKVSRGTTQDGLEAALRMAMHRYGQRITVNGSDQFKEQIAQIATSAKLNITFDDIALEKRRQDLAQALTTPEKINEQQLRGINTEPRRQNRRGVGNAGAVSATSRRVATARKHGVRGRIGRRSKRDQQRVMERGIKPNIAKVGRRPPPQRQNQMHDLSQLDVVHIVSGSELLLPLDVSPNMDKQKTKPNIELRRGVSGAGVVNQISAADKYIAEREAKRSIGIDIPKHRKFNASDEGAVSFSGIRQIDGEALALFKRDEQVVVQPVDDATARRLKRFAVGDVVTLTEKGTVKTKGRSR